MRFFFLSGTSLGLPWTTFDGTMKNFSCRLVHFHMRFQESSSFKRWIAYCAHMLCIWKKKNFMKLFRLSIKKRNIELYLTLRVSLSFMFPQCTPHRKFLITSLSSTKISFMDLCMSLEPTRHQKSFATSFIITSMENSSNQNQCVKHKL